MSVEFLSVADLLFLHEQQIALFGGAAGIRDRALLESAAMQPSASYGGLCFHEFPWEMAAAYLFHLCGNHPFVDGNKRVALAATLVFLDINGFPILGGTEELYLLTMDVASGAASRDEAAVRLRAIHERQ